MNDHTGHQTDQRPADQFSRSIEGLATAGPVRGVTVADGGTYELRAAPVRKRIGAADVRMLAYNGSIPGPVLHVRQGSEITVRFANDTELDTTVHWHGLRHDYLYDGVANVGHHGGMQDPVPPGGGWTYRLRFPDAGVFWYHPHLREDYTQEMGLYGNIIVEPAEPDYWPPVNREIALVLDDLLMQDGDIAPFHKEGSSHTAMGRFGNVMLVNGETDLRLTARRGEVVRLYLTNTANTRVFRLALRGARMKLVGSDLGRIEQERFCERVLIAPSERWIVDVYFPEAGEYTLEHVGDERSYELARLSVSEEAAERHCAREFAQLRHNPEFAEERARLDAELAREPDKVLILEAEMPRMAHGGGMEHGGMEHGGMEHGAMAKLPAIEWEDTMPEHNEMSTPETMRWRITDEGSGRRNHAIHWVFQRGDRVKIRIVNDPGSDHPMQHPIHFHGQRFYELEWDGRPSESLVWKDTVLIATGMTVDILLDCTNPGSWMVHCHIAEHLEAGMMFTFEVRDTEEQDEVQHLAS